MSPSFQDNNSDSELHHQNVQQIDFTSFPTISDPEAEHRGFTRLLSSTIRSVTNNVAANVVANAGLVSPKRRNVPVDQQIPPQTPPSPTPIKSSKATSIISIDGSGCEPRSLEHGRRASGETDYGDQRETLPKASVEPTLLLGKPHRLVTAPASVAPVQAADAIVDIVLRQDQRPVVSSMGYGGITTSKALENNLHTKLTAAFNNLPNDIDISDDSASDSENPDSSGGVNKLQGSVSPAKSLPPPPLASSSFSTSTLASFATPSNAHASADNTVGSLRTSEAPSTPNYTTDSFFKSNAPFSSQKYQSFNEGSMYSGLVARPSPVKVDRQISQNQGPASEFMATALRHHKLEAESKKSHFPTAILGNAKNFVNSNFHDAVSLASSLVTQEKRRRKKPVRSSHNPLKNGGIPRKYWMNDSFVSDCLNCFKPFTAFRRKHHCRFCGQIFCADCTLFISYLQHRVEKQRLANQTFDSLPKMQHNHTHYKDKLRVCTPCYLDVIVYLSDDDSSEGSDMEITRSNRNSITSQVTPPPPSPGQQMSPQNHPLNRVRTLSIGSRAQTLSALTSCVPEEDEGKDNTVTSGTSDTLPKRDVESGVPYTIAQMMLNDNKQTHTKLVPQMAIPATRAGLAVEIPVLRTLLTSSHFAPMYTSSKTYGGGTLKLGTSAPAITQPIQNHQHRHHRSHHHHRSHRSHHRESPSPNNHAFQGKAVWSAKNDASVEYGGSNATRQVSSSSLRSGPFGTLVAQELLSSDLENDSDGGMGRNDSDVEDEQVMSLYSALHASSNPHLGVIEAAGGPQIVPTLGEFPTMAYSDREIPLKWKPSWSKTSTVGGTSASEVTEYGAAATTPTTSTTSIPTVNNTSPSHSNGQEDTPSHGERLRAQARANASLQRIRLRRRNRLGRLGGGGTNSGGGPRGGETLKHRSEFGGQDMKASTISNAPSMEFEHATLSPSTKNSANSLLAPLTLIPSPEHDPNARTLTHFNIHSEDDSSLAPSPRTIVDKGSVVAEVPVDEISEEPRPDMESDVVKSEPAVMLVEEQDDREMAAEIEKRKIHSLYYSLLDTLIVQTLTDCEISQDHSRWVRAIRRLLAPIRTLNITDTLDTRQYIKIKRIPGGRIEDMMSFPGLFMTKNIDSRRMEHSIVNPRIALLTFPLEYLKQKEQFISLRIIHSQQLVYITNLVSRLVSLEPDLVVVGDSVCGIARSLLEDAGVTVLSNVKPQNIERISRYTSADIFQSVNDLFFKKGSLGTCERFHVQKHLHGNSLKACTYFDGTIEDNGFTVTLRGGSNETLASVKYAMEIVLPGYLSSRFETSFFTDACMQVQDGDKAKNAQNARIALVMKQIKQLQAQDPDCGIALSPTEVISYLNFFNERILSLSPLIQFPIPAKLAHLILSYYDYLRGFQENVLIQAATTIDEITPETLVRLGISFDGRLMPRGDADLRVAATCASEHCLKTLLEQYQTRSRIWSQCISAPCYQLYPTFHRSIHALTSTISIKYATPCAGPNHLVIDYYTDNDRELGSFLDEMFVSVDKVCDECHEQLLNHYKTYVHGEAKLDFVVEKIEGISEIDEYEGKNQRVMWSSCKACNYATPVMPMSDDTFHLSIGKFLELNFYGSGVSSHFGGGGGGGTCTHDYFQNHTKYFGLGNMVIRVEYSCVNNYQVELPKKRMQLNPAVDIRLKLEAYNSIEVKSERLFMSVLKRLTRVKVDTFDKVDEGLERIEQMKQKLEAQRLAIRASTLHVYESTEPTLHLSLNSVLRELQEVAVAWDEEFNEFEARFLPSENEITRITQFHLSSFLIERNAAQDHSITSSGQVDRKNVGQAGDFVSQETGGGGGGDTDGAAATDNTTGTGDKSSNAESEPNQEDLPSLLPSSPQETPESTLLTSDNKDYTQPLKAPNSLIMERISRIEALLDTERQTTVAIPAAPVTASSRQRNLISSQCEISPACTSAKVALEKDAADVPNKVVRLANLYNKMNLDKISLEFRKQREAEMQKKSHKYRAFPIVESKPVVKIYNNIEDVVVDGNEEFPGVKKAERSGSGESARGGGAATTTTAGIKFSNNKPSRCAIVTNNSTFAKPLKPIFTNDLQTESDTTINSAGTATTNGGGAAANTSTVIDPIPASQSTPPSHSNEIIPTGPAISTKSMDIPQPEKVSLLRSLTNFWADRSATLWDSLEYPLESHEHTFADSTVIVREDEPSSLVAFCLSSSDYRQKIDQMGAETGDATDTEFQVETTEHNDEKVANFAKIQKKFKKRSAYEKLSSLEKTMNKVNSNHLKYQFSDNNTTFLCKIFYSEQFDAFRSACGINGCFIQSLSRCVKWNSSGGKSGSHFLKTLDDRFIIKELSKSELDLFVSIAPFYFQYGAQSMFNSLTTAIAKIYGFYQIHIKNNLTGKQHRMEFLIMENLFCSQNPTRIFDLKGSMRNRHVQQTGKENEVLLDENMIEYIYELPVFVNEQLKKLLRGLLFNDTSFLLAMDVMDYSLVVGIDDQAHKLYIGIIDWLRAFTWDKRVENWVKGNNLMAIRGAKKGKDPTIVTPKQYKTRFREAMERYLLQVPDIWYEGGDR